MSGGHFMINKGTIIYIGGFELPDRNAAAHQVLNNARIFRDLGYKVVFCGINRNIVESQSQFHETVLGFDSYPVPYPKSTREWIKYMVDYDSIRRVIDEEQNVKYVITYNVHAIPLRKTINYCKGKGIKVIANVTEWYENPFSLSPGKAVRWLDTMLVMHRYHKKADGIIAVSKYLQNFYSRYVPDIIVLPPFVDINESKWKESIPYTPNPKIEFVYSGTIEPGSNERKDKLCPIIDCFELLAEKFEFHFSIVGISENDFTKQFPSMTNKINRLERKVTFYGRVPHADSINMLKRADYCIFVRDSSRKNNAGFPTKFVESWTSGVNIIASNISDIKDYFPSDGKSIILDNNDPETIQNALVQVLSEGLAELSNSRREGLGIDNPFYYKNWESKVEAFLCRLS